MINELETTASIIVGKASQHLRKIRRHGLGPIQEKTDGTSVTRIDQSLDHLIREHILAAYPDDSILSEENGYHRGTSGRLWIYDPIDGTSGLIKDNGEYVIQLGILDRHTPESRLSPRYATISHPSTRESYKGRMSGSWHSIPFQGTQPLNTRKDNPERLIRVTDHRENPALDLDHDTIKTGSEGLRILAVARGDAHFHLNTGEWPSLWDTLAPETILTGAGGVLKHLDGSRIDYTERESRIRRPYIAASSNAVYERVREACLAAGITPGLTKTR